MRPVRLEMDGFASFRAKTTIEFTGADFFALVGPTGAGKSTVIDAMVFALYGTAPRWGAKNSVQYALAPTATKAVVRFVFDVGAQRYQVAREVRRVGSNPSQKSAVLERFDDPSATTATSDEVTPLATEVREVTPAVQELLGLSFDDFTKAVVLPQGRFAEFLNATAGERQDILLKLLGAHQYDLVMRAAGVRRGQADAALTTAEARIGDLADITPEAERSTAARAGQLRALTTRVEALEEALAAARTAAHGAATAAADAAQHLVRLKAVAIPAGLAQRVEQAASAQTTAEQLSQDAVAAESAYTAARTLLKAAGKRSDVERIHQLWIEHEALLVALPQQERAQERAADTVTAADAAADRADTEHTEAITRRADAQQQVEATAATLAALTQRRDALGTLTPPEGLADLVERWDAADAALAQAQAALQAADADEDAARAVQQAAGDQTALVAEVRRTEEALDLIAKQDSLRAHVAEARAVATAAHHAAALAHASLSQAQTEVEHAREEGDAAVLRSHLTVGQDCPVCAAPVAALPAPLDLARAQAAQTRLEQEQAEARVAQQAADRADAEQSGWERTLADTTADLALRLPAGADAHQQHATATAALDRARSASTAWEQARDARQAAQRALAHAQDAARALQVERDLASSALRAAQSRAAVHGAPDPGAVSVPRAWAALQEWAQLQRADLETVTLPQAREAQAAARSAIAAAEDAVTRSSALRQEAADAARMAHAALTRAQDANMRSRERRTQVQDALAQATSAAETLTLLERLGALEDAERDAADALSTAGRARDEAQSRRAALQAELAQAEALLRATHEPLATLGAPAVDPADLLGSWAALTDWAFAARDAAIRASAQAQRADHDAVAAVDAAAAALVEAARTQGVHVDSASQVVAAVAGQTALAEAEHRRVCAALERLRTLLQERDEAIERRDVAALLADQLSAKKFQRWLAGAALDVLVEAASASLLELSGGQFSLAHDRGEFHVVDHADAEARRSVRTLSGGETFQASLALALALSAELGSMSSQAARLESIFLDEGFGSLDPESLDVVATTLERLAHGDRVVGVVTHVPGLAERIPTRFTVTRTSRGSSVVREG